MHPLPEPTEEKRKPFKVSCVAVVCGEIKRHLVYVEFIRASDAVAFMRGFNQKSLEWDVGLPKERPSFMWRGMRFYDQCLHFSRVHGIDEACVKASIFDFDSPEIPTAARRYIRRRLNSKEYFYDPPTTTSDGTDSE